MTPRTLSRNRVPRCPLFVKSATGEGVKKPKRFLLPVCGVISHSSGFLSCPVFLFTKGLRDMGQNKFPTLASKTRVVSHFAYFGGAR
jgi:hypothetical protein